MKPLSNILCPVDFSDSSRHALRYALELAEALGASLKLVHAYHVPHYIQPSLLVWMGTGSRPFWEVAEEQARTEFDDFMRRVAPGARVEKTLVMGDPVATVLSLVERDGHDLVVMGTHGRTGAARIVMGSVAERIVRRCPCPVITVPTAARDQTGAANDDTTSARFG